MWNYVWIIRSTPFNIAPCNGLQGALLTKKSLYWRQDTIAPFSSEQKLTHKNCNLHKMYQILCCLPNHACRKSRLCWVNSLPPVRIADRLKITPGVFVWRIRIKRRGFQKWFTPIVRWGHCNHTGIPAKICVMLRKNRKACHSKSLTTDEIVYFVYATHFYGNRIVLTKYLEWQYIAFWLLSLFLVPAEGKGVCLVIKLIWLEAYSSFQWYKVFWGTFHFEVMWLCKKL